MAARKTDNLRYAFESRYGDLFGPYDSEEELFGEIEDYVDGDYETGDPFITVYVITQERRVAIDRKPEVRWAS